jgi:predicted deacylase
VTESKDEVIVVGGHEVARGTSESFELPVARLFTGSWMNLPVTVIHGSKPGPKVWLDAALHGDELNGMEAIRLALREIHPEILSGTVIAVPVVNVFGFVLQNRYLPDRRDLNRCFPGSARGSLAGRLAHLFLQEVVSQCNYGLDLHTGSLHRGNLPQVRGALDHPETRRIAEAFGAPLMISSKTIKGSLRAAARRRGIPILVYEAGEPLRFHQEAIDTGRRGILRVLQVLDMLPGKPEPLPPAFEAASTRWLRASKSGIFRPAIKLGSRVDKGQVLATISDFHIPRERAITAPNEGLIIGITNNPLVHRGDALIHLAREVE